MAYDDNGNWSVEPNTVAPAQDFVVQQQPAPQDFAVQQPSASTPDWAAYTAANPDVAAAAAAAGVDPSAFGAQHYAQYGQTEGRALPSDTASSPFAVAGASPMSIADIGARLGAENGAVSDLTVQPSYTYGAPAP